MFGFFGLMAFLLTLISLASYWISWDLQNKENRSSFATMAWRDFVVLVGKSSGGLRNGERRWRRALDAYATHEPAKRTDAIQ